MVYIYPKGVTGRQLAWMMEYVDGIKPVFIDDGNYASSFEALKDKITKDDIAYVALSKFSPQYKSNLYKITQNLEKYNIAYQVDAVERYVKKAVTKLKNECKSEGLDKIVALVMTGFAKNKHFGELGVKLAQRFKDISAGGGGYYIFVQMIFHIISICKKKWIILNYFMFHTST